MAATGTRPRLAALAFGRGEVDEAEKLVRRSLELETDLRSSRFYLGRILEARGDRASRQVRPVTSVWNSAPA